MEDEHTVCLDLSITCRCDCTLNSEILYHYFILTCLLIYFNIATMLTFRYVSLIKSKILARSVLLLIINY